MIIPNEAVSISIRDIQVGVLVEFFFFLVFVNYVNNDIFFKI